MWFSSCTAESIEQHLLLGDGRSFIRTITLKFPNLDRLKWEPFGEECRSLDNLEELRFHFHKTQPIHEWKGRIISHILPKYRGCEDFLLVVTIDGDEGVLYRLTRCERCYNLDSYEQRRVQ